jgi:hypothetical protein
MYKQMFIRKLNTEILIFVFGFSICRRHERAQTATNGRGRGGRRKRVRKKESARCGREKRRGEGDWRRGEEERRWLRIFGKGDEGIGKVEGEGKGEGFV